MSLFFYTSIAKASLANGWIPFLIRSLGIDYGIGIGF